MDSYHATPQMLQAAELLNRRALERINLQYGSDGARPLAYHNCGHTVDVILAASALGNLAVERRHISPHQNVLLRIAAGYHDVVHGLGSIISETRSATIAADHMFDFTCFTRADRLHVAEMIESTVCTVTENDVTQAADPDNYPAALLCDADLSNLGMPFPQFRERAFAMFQEWGSKPGNNGRFMKFLYLEPTLLRTHTYLTEEADELFPNMLQNADQLELVREMYAVQ